MYDLKCLRLKSVKYILSILLFTALVACSDSFKPEVSVGEKVPASSNKLVEKDANWREVCSMDTPDNLHKWQISELRAKNKPFLVVFGTPQHCTMCVDQLIRVASLQEKYGDRFAFLHVDGYRDDAVWVEWGIKGEPWTYIVDEAGVVQNIFPGPTDAFLMEQAVDKVLK
jgi:thioredoxin-like negative regulator of GroEL